MAELTNQPVSSTLQTTNPTPTDLERRLRMNMGGGAMPSPNPGFSPNMMMQQKETIRFQPWLSLETAASWGEIVQPASQWLAGAQVPTYQMQVQIMYLAGATLLLESSPTAEGPWATVVSYTAQTNTMIMLASEGGGFAGYIRWRVEGTAAWQICFQLRATPGASVMQQMGTPKRV